MFRLCCNLQWIKFRYGSVSFASPSLSHKVTARSYVNSDISEDNENVETTLFTICRNLSLDTCQSREDTLSSNNDSDIEKDTEDEENDSQSFACTSSHAEDTTTVDSEPSQLILSQYNRKMCGTETTNRDFNPEWYKTYPWLSYEASERRFVCFPCKELMTNFSFQFVNWKKSERLKKHEKSNRHQLAKTKWISYRVYKRCDTSVLMQLHNAHKQEVAHNREYLKVIIECLFYTAQQNVAQRGHVMKKDVIWIVPQIKTEETF